MSLLKHHKSDLAVLDISGRHGAASQSFNRRPVGHQVFVGLKLGSEEQTLATIRPVMTSPAQNHGFK
jgi:hypothetical protein